MGANGRFTEVGGAAGLADTGWTLATSTFDYDNDGDLDLFLANDFGADTFYRNKGDGTFEDVSAVTQTADRGSGMNVSTTDVNGDGWLDFYVSNIDMFSKNIKVVFPTESSTINNMDVSLQRSFQYLSGNKLWVNPGDPAGHKPFIAEQGTRFEPGDRGWGWAAVLLPAASLRAPPNSRPRWVGAPRGPEAGAFRGTWRLICR
jgi:FG-GAP-like repeat